MFDTPTPLYLVALQTATGGVTFLVTRHPDTQLEHLGMTLEVARRHAVQTPHANRIAAELREEFAACETTSFGDRPYYLADWEDVGHAIADFDLATGMRTHRAGVSVGDRVWIDLSTAAPQYVGRGKKGEVTAISGRRYLVRLEEPVGDLLALWAPRRQIKPVLRAVMEAA